MLNEWWKTAHYVKNNPNIKLFEIDWKHNEVKDFEVGKLPSLMFYPSNLKHKPISFLHATTFDAIITALQ